jgi:predicted nucleic acid-binding protein
VIAVDTSVAIAALAPWHERHEVARAIVDHRPSIAAHAAFETYSVLTRLPSPHRVPASVAAEYLTARFAEPWLDVPPGLAWEMVGRWPSTGITGGAIYDAVIAASSVRADAELATCDRRALTTYVAYGARVRLI